MIHVRTQLADTANHNQPVIHFSVVGLPAMQQLQQILGRALNCADPQKYPDWVEVSDRLESFILQSITGSKG